MVWTAATIFRTVFMILAWQLLTLALFDLLIARIMIGLFGILTYGFHAYIGIFFIFLLFDS